jgi:GGDEF domain-containing protein
LWQIHLRLLVEHRKALTSGIAASRDFGVFVQDAGVPVSIGAAQYSSDETLEECFARADEALYGAKRRGRNRTCCAAPAPG